MVPSPSLPSQPSFGRRERNMSCRWEQKQRCKQAVTVLWAFHVIHVLRGGKRWKKRRTFYFKARFSKMVLGSQCPLAVGDSWGSSAPFDAKLVIFYFFVMSLPHQFYQHFYLLRSNTYRPCADWGCVLLGLAWRCRRRCLQHQEVAEGREPLPWGSLGFKVWISPEDVKPSGQAGLPRLPAHLLPIRKTQLFPFVMHLLA